MVVRPWKIWSEEIARCICAADDEQLAFAAVALSTADVVLTAGNGGSSAIASHAAQALMKPGYKAGGGVAAVCLTDGIPTLSAHANDGGWPTALIECAHPFFERNLPVLLLFSSSGRSENIVKLAELGRARDCEIIAFTGFDGEPLRSLATVAFHVDSHDYEVVEPAHDALLHRVQYHLRNNC